MTAHLKVLIGFGSVSEESTNLMTSAGIHTAVRTLSLRKLTAGHSVRNSLLSPRPTILNTTRCSLVAMVGALADSPVQTACPKCHQSVLSKVDYSSGLLTYLCCGGLFLCCCLIPFCVNRLKDATHICPTCKTVLGVYKRL
uniref:LITAF domain-containing protein n=1 Tax=Amphiprion ocellaris TaxID=80972 RepID=A0AAQ6AAS2_AMPOC